MHGAGGNPRIISRSCSGLHLSTANFIFENEYGTINDATEFDIGLVQPSQP